MAIRSFRHRGLKQFFEKGTARGIDARLADKIEEMLFAIDTADDVSDVDLFPGWRLHRLSGDLDGFWSLTVTGNRRLIFRFEDGEADDVDLVDYH